MCVKNENKKFHLIFQHS